MSKKDKAKRITEWNPRSWRGFPIKQQPSYDDISLLKNVEDALGKKAPLAHPDEIKTLKQKLADVAMGKAFLLQGGDCAESFAEFNEGNLRDYFRVILQMTVALMYGAGKPVVKVGRIAGQFAKPRSSDFEEKDGVSLPSYRGDMVNGIDFSSDARKPDPERLLEAYNQAASTLNYLRALAKGGFSSLRNINKWNYEFTSECAQGRMFRNLITRISESLSFMEAFGLKLDSIGEIREADFYTSHEALLLNYEEAMVRQDHEGAYFDCSAHMLWIGDRTRNLKEAHIEFMRGIENPIGIKIGPTTDADELIELLNVVNPDNIAGKVTLISRMGADKVEEFLPKLVRKVKQEGNIVVWSCDPMHGNTTKSPNGYKTRHFNKIMSEVKSVFEIHHAEGTYAGGIHIEMTGQDVTECVGGSQAISEVNLKDRYHTHCDPRLNASQSIELAFLLSEELRENYSNNA